ncbi:uncharacterized protein LOC144341134 [Macaca mulatta]
MVRCGGAQQEVFQRDTELQESKGLQGTFAMPQGTNALSSFSLQPKLSHMDTPNCREMMSLLWMARCSAKPAQQNSMENGENSLGTELLLTTMDFNSVFLSLGIRKASFPVVSSPMERPMWQAAGILSQQTARA